ncbi:MAG: colicin V production protein [Desulfobacterium sp.]|nr:colicin V production protein [Desulfobacterium sp.]
MNFLDILFVAILVFCLIRGLFRGLVLELSSIIGVLAGIYLASIYYPAVSQVFSQWVSDAAYRNIISLILIFIGIFILVNLLGRLIKMILKIAFMGWFDRIFGAGFGALKGCLIGSVLFLTLTTFLPKDASIIQDSKLSPYISICSEKISHFVPNGMQNSFTTNIDRVKKVWKSRN